MCSPDSTKLGHSRQVQLSCTCSLLLEHSHRNFQFLNLLLSKAASLPPTPPTAASSLRARDQWALRPWSLHFISKWFFKELSKQRPSLPLMMDKRITFPPQHYMCICDMQPQIFLEQGRLQIKSVLIVSTSLLGQKSLCPVIRRHSFSFC